MKQISLWIVAIVFLNPQFAISQERKLEPFIVAYASVTANRAPLWIAKDTGLFEKYGLDVKLVTIAAGNVILSALSDRRCAFDYWCRTGGISYSGRPRCSNYDRVNKWRISFSVG